MARSRPPLPPSSGSASSRQQQARDAQQQALANFNKIAAEKAEKARAEQERLSQRRLREAASFAGAVEQIPFYRSDVNEALHVGESYKSLCAVAVRAMNEVSREAVLCWPNSDPSPAALVAILALADCAAATPIRLGEHDALASPHGLRALVYPYARTAHYALRHIYVDRDYVGRIQLKHQIRASQAGEDTALADYHKTLARSRSLSGLATDGNNYAEFRHPCLDETLPSGLCVGEEGRRGLLWRVRTKTDLSGGIKRSISRSGDADDPSKARFYLFGVRASEKPKPAFAAIKGPIDLVLLDLDATGRNRLGDDWLQYAREFLAEVAERFGPTAVVAMTDDPWAYDKLRFEGLVERAKKGRSPPARSSVIFSPTSDIVASTTAVPLTFSPLGKCEVFGFAGALSEALAALRAGARKAEDIGDRLSASRLRVVAGKVRRSASLPGTLIQLGEYISEEVEAQAAADMIANYRVNPDLTELRSVASPYSQLHHAELLALCEQVETIGANAERATSIAPLVRDVVKRYLRASSRVVLLFANDMIADFAAHALSRDEEIGDTVTERRESDMLVFTHRAGLYDLAALPPASRNYIKTLVVVSPSRASMASLLAMNWLPENLIVLADCDTLGGAARDATRLGKYDELASLAARMTKFSSAASAEVQKVTFKAVDLDPEIAPTEDVEFPLGGIVDLAGKVRANQTVLRFELEGGQVLLTRPGTKLVVHDTTRTVSTFEQVEAKSVDVGDRLCVISDAFLEMARPLLNMKVRAAEEIRDYHKLVLDRFARIPLATDGERLEYIVARMGIVGVSAQRARYWLDLDQQLEAPLHEVVPHAPRDWATFAAFMAALDVGETMAYRFWIWAVIAQRGSRLRAALSFHEAYRGILVDPYAVQSDNPERIRDVRRLRAAAENHVSVVRRKREERAGHVGV